MATEAQATIEPIPDLKYWCDGQPSEVGKRVALMLALWACGSHHLDADRMRHADWKNPRFIEIIFDSSTIGECLSTFDGDAPTRLIFLAHDHGIRVELTPSNRNSLRLMFHPRGGREGSIWYRHPTIEQALARWREAHPQPVFVGSPEKREPAAEPVCADRCQMTGEAVPS